MTTTVRVLEHVAAILGGLTLVLALTCAILLLLVMLRETRGKK